MNYGVPYKGSKNKIAEWVCEQFPKADNFYDLFAGGCAITHGALLSQKFQNFYVNDLWTAPQLFLDAINGKFKNETRWISREEFFSERLKNPYIQFCWSFGRNGNSYIYSREIEPYKKACHFAIVLDDWTNFQALCPEVAESTWKVLENVADIHERRMKFGPAVVRKLKAMGDVSVLERNPLYSSCQLKKSNEARHKRLQRLENLRRLQSLQSLEGLERLQSLESLQSLQSLQSLHIIQGDYRNVPIKHNSVIYCDIPYKNTDGYNFSDENSFDYNAFYYWCGKQKELVIVSEYNMPDDFICIAQKEKRCSLNGGNGKIRIEKLFVPKHQIELYKSLMQENKQYKDSDFVQLEFDFISA